MDMIKRGNKGSFFLYLQNFFYTSKIFLNSQKILWPFKETRGHHTPKIMSTSGSQNIWLPKVKIYHWKLTFESPNISPEVDFWKSKCITGSWLPKVKMYHRKLTSRSQKVSPKVNFRKSKYITRSRLSEVKIYHGKWTFGSQNVSTEVNFRKSKNITKSRLPEVKNLILF